MVVITGKESPRVPSLSKSRDTEIVASEQVLSSIEKEPPSFLLHSDAPIHFYLNAMLIQVQSSLVSF